MLRVEKRTEKMEANSNRVTLNDWAAKQLEERGYEPEVPFENAFPPEPLQDVDRKATGVPPPKKRSLLENHNAALKSYLRGGRYGLLAYDIGLSATIAVIIFKAYPFLGFLVFCGLILLGFGLDALIKGISPSHGVSQFTQRQAKRAYGVICWGLFCYVTDGAIVMHKLSGAVVEGWLYYYSMYGTLAQGPLFLVLVLWVYRSSSVVVSEEFEAQANADFKLMETEDEYNDRLLNLLIANSRRKILKTIGLKAVEENKKIVKKYESTYRSAAQNNVPKMIRGVSAKLLAPSAAFPLLEEDASPGK